MYLSSFYHPINILAHRNRNFYVFMIYFVKLFYFNFDIKTLTINSGVQWLYFRFIHIIGGVQHGPLSINFNHVQQYALKIWLNISIIPVEF